MASMVAGRRTTLKILDAGAGVGSLSAALLAELCGRPDRPMEVQITAYELDQGLIPYLTDTYAQCHSLARDAGIAFQSEIVQNDFVEASVEMLRGGWFAPEQRLFDCAILNPPYRKITGGSQERLLLRSISIETSNLYTAFLTLVVRLLKDEGELVGITPRSFCNGPYFRPFRKEFLQEMRLCRLHVFESRRTAFADADVLQENVIIHAVKDRKPRTPVVISSSSGPDDDVISIQEVAFGRLVQPDDPQLFIRIAPDDHSHGVAERMSRLPATLDELGLAVSTGRVVDFRAKEHLRQEPGHGAAPLIYPAHFAGGYVAWPRQTRKPNALALAPDTEDLLLPPGIYVLVKRFSSKEERRRVVAAIYDPVRTSHQAVGFENHLNYFHRGGSGLSLGLARGLSAFLNSSLVDVYFRQFSGHTQVNATDLRSLRYPSLMTLERLGSQIGAKVLEQQALDRLVEEELVSSSEVVGGNSDPIRAKEKIDLALAILKLLGLPRGQQNERSALTLLALLDLSPGMTWDEASNPLRGITPLMEFMATHYRRTYAPNTRETVRRSTMHQFIEAGIVAANPDEPERPTNDPRWVYQVQPAILDLIRTFDTVNWDENLQTYLVSVETLQQRYASERTMQLIPVVLPTEPPSRSHPVARILS